MPSPCQNIANSLNELLAERSDLQTELRSAAPGAKGYLGAQINRLNRSIAPTRQALAACRAQNPGPAPLPPLNTSLTGTYVLSIQDPNIPALSGLYVASVQFDAARTYFSIQNLALDPPAPFNTPFGPNTTTVSLRTRARNRSFDGTFDKNSGNINLVLPLRFDNSDLLLFIDEDSDIDFALGTFGGSPVNTQGQVNLTGSGVFVGGVPLGGKSANLTLTGAFSPAP